MKSARSSPGINLSQGMLIGIDQVLLDRKAFFFFKYLINLKAYSCRDVSVDKFAEMRRMWLCQLMMTRRFWKGIRQVCNTQRQTTRNFEVLMHIRHYTVSHCQMSRQLTWQPLPQIQPLSQCLAEAGWFRKTQKCCSKSSWYETSCFFFEMAQERHMPLVKEALAGVESGKAQSVESIRLLYIQEDKGHDLHDEKHEMPWICTNSLCLSFLCELLGFNPCNALKGQRLPWWSHRQQPPCRELVVQYSAEDYGAVCWCSSPFLSVEHYLQTSLEGNILVHTRKVDACVLNTSFMRLNSISTCSVNISKAEEAKQYSRSTTKSDAWHGARHQNFKVEHELGQMKKASWCQGRIGQDSAGKRWQSVGLFECTLYMPWYSVMMTGTR